MDKLPRNDDCVLSGTKYCRELHMRTCESCTVRGSANLEEIKSDIDLYETLLPEGGVARLFESHECMLCNGESKGRRHGYAILDMAHPEPKRVQKWLFGKRVSAVGTMIPLQFAVCKRCRSHYLVMEYLPLALPVLVGAVGLAVVSIDAVHTPLAAISRFLPFGLWIFAVLLTALLSRLAAERLKRKWAHETYTDILTHPVVAEMLAKGWKPIAAKSRTKLLFSKTRVARGLGTAPSVQTETDDEGE